MKKTKFHRLLAFALALCFLIGGTFTVTVSAKEDQSTTDKTLAEIKEQLNAISYQEYISKYLSQAAAGTDTIVIEGADYLEYSLSDSETYQVKVIDGALYTPGAGTVTWEVPGITEAKKYSIVIEYWPDEAKSTSIERILKINGKIPFAEARYVTLPKIWKNTYVAAKVTSEDKSVDELYNEALKDGAFAESALAKKDGYLEIQAPEIWTAANSAFVEKYTVRFLGTDIDNNEIRPTFNDVPEWRSYELRDINGFYVESFEFVFEPDEVTGKTTISLEAVNEPMTIKQIKLIPHESYNSYEEYLDTLTDEQKKSGKDTIIIQSEYTGATSTQTIYPIEDRSDAATQPSDTGRVVLNTIGGEKWQTAGQWARYSFRVTSSGMYDIAARFRQNVLDGMYVNRSLYIYSEGVNEGEAGYYDGIPFTEAGQLRFNYSADWQSSLMNDGATDKDGNLLTYSFYFKEGVTYTIEVEVTIGSMGDIVRRVEAALNSVNNDYLSILKLTGASPDEYRDYGFSRIMPDVLVDMILQSREFYKIAELLTEITGEKSSNVATLEKIAWLLERMGSNEDEIAKYMSQLKSYIGSLGTWLGDAKTQPLQLDCLVIQPLGKEPPEATAGFFASLAHEFKSFIMSFFRNYDRMGAIAEDETGEHVVDVWIATGRDQAQVLRNLINNDFTPTYGHTVNLQLVAGGTLLPSVLAGMGPDVYIGVSDDTVINYAIRGALLSIDEELGKLDKADGGNRLEEFKKFALEYEVNENFQKIYDANGEPIYNPESQFNEAAMIVMGIEDAEGKFHYYGLPESQGFSMMFLRTDVLADLEIEIPRTWDDILAAIPILQANNMEIGMHQDYKIFLYQMGGELFADDGMRINLDSNLGLEAFDTMCSYFTMYSFPVSYDFANRFRTGEMPIGFAGYTGTYNQLVVFATEIKGLWEFYPMPGIIQKDAEGNDLIDENGDPIINNVSVSSSSAIVMMNGCTNIQGSWDFMTWKVGAKAEIENANEMVAIMGPSAKQSTANKFALAEMPWTTAEYKQINYQYNNLASIPNYPGAYIISRYTNFAFLAAYNDNANPITELQSYITTINKEIARKRAEFDLETLECEHYDDLPRDERKETHTTRVEKRICQVKYAYSQDIEDMTEAQINAAKSSYDKMMEGIKKENAEMLETAAAGFKAVNATGFADTIKWLGEAVYAIRNQ